MKRSILISSLFLVLVGVLSIRHFGFKAGHETSEVSNTDTEKEKAEQKQFSTRDYAVLPPSQEGVYLLPEISEHLVRLHHADTPPMEDLEILEIILDSYRKGNHGVNPAGGLNDEITASLTGVNTKKLQSYLPIIHLYL